MKNYTVSLDRVLCLVGLGLEVHIAKTRWLGCYTSSTSHLGFGTEPFFSLVNLFRFTEYMAILSLTEDYSS